MPVFNRKDICEAYYQLEVDYNINGWLRERPSNLRRRESTDVQLHRMGVRIAPNWNGFESLSPNGVAIYKMLQKRYYLPSDEDMRESIDSQFFDQGWTDETLLALALQFIQESGAEASFMEHLQEQADRENQWDDEDDDSDEDDSDD